MAEKCAAALATCEISMAAEADAGEKKRVAAYAVFDRLVTAKAAAKSESEKEKAQQEKEKVGDKWFDQCDNKSKPFLLCTLVAPNKSSTSLKDCCVKSLVLRSRR